MGSIESGIRDLLDLVGKQRDELATLRAENERLRGALVKIMKEDQAMTGGGMCPNIIGPCHRIAKEALK